MAEKVLIVDDDLDTLRLVGLMLQRQGYQISVATDGQQGLDKAIAEKPDLVLLDVMMPEMDGYEVTRRLRENPVTAKIPILMFTAKTQLDDKVAGFEVGADDYLTKPTHPSELQSHVKALLSRSGRETGRMTTSSSEFSGHVIGILSARGGLGVSTLAANLSASLFKKTHAEIILAELTPGQGSLGVELGINNIKGLSELLAMPPGEITRGQIAERLIPHTSGVKLLLASNHPKDYKLINQISQYENLVARLGRLGQFVVLDLGMGLQPFVQHILPLCHELVVVVEGIPNTIIHTRALIEDLLEMGVNKTHILVALNNRVRAENQMPWADVQKQLGHPISATLTPAPELFQQASRMQTPAVLCQPDSLTTQQIGKLVEIISEHESQAQ